MTEARRNRLNTWVAILERKVATLYGETYVKALKLPEIKAAINANDTEFDWSKYPGGEAKLEKLITNLNKELNAIVASATASAYDMGASDADDEVKGLLGKNRMSKRFLAEVSEQAANQRREDGMTGSNYIHEKRGGFELSDRVWKVTSQSKQELTMMVQAGIIEGKSADEMSRDVRGNLQNPKMLFRRVRDKETGELRLSKAAKEYHPGQGVYRSSYKNAVRMTRTEVNQGYRVGEQQAYSNNPLVKGYDIMLSNNHTTKLPNGKKVELHDICDELAGRYPKTFVWSGWHPQCRCKMVPVPLSPEEFGEYMRLKKAGELRKWRDPSVKDYPSNFKDWVTDRKPLIEIAANRGKLPYFLQDNPYTWKERPRPTPIDIAKVRHDNRTEDQITAIRNKWAEHQRIQEIVRQIMRENSKPYYEGVYADEINACGSVKELSALMTSKGVTTSASFGTMTISDAKEVCLAAAEMQKRFSLRAIEVKMGGSSRSGWYMRAHGGQVEINSGYWKAASIDDTLKKGFYDSVSNYVTSKKKAIDARNADIDMFKKRLADAIKNGDKSSESYYPKLIKKSEKEIKRIQDLIDAGVNRYNQFLSRETMIRDCFAHEMGHVTHDQVTGGINGAAFRRKRYDVAECAAMNSEIRRLFSKYSKGDKFVTEYGMTKPNEFLAESMVLYMYRPSKLPQDVFEWFEKLEKMAHGGKIPTKTISYDEAFEIYKQEYDGKMRIQMAAEKRHAARTPEREEEIREFWRKKKEEGDKRRRKEAILEVANKRHADVARRKKIQEMATARQHMYSLLEKYDGMDMLKKSLFGAYRMSGQSKADEDMFMDMLTDMQKKYDSAKASALDAVGNLEGIKGIGVDEAKANIGDMSMKEIIDIEKDFVEKKGKLEGLSHVGDGIEAAKKYGYNEVVLADDAIEAKLTQWENLSLEQQKKKIEFEIQFVENPGAYKNGAVAHSTWKLAQDAYKKQLTIVYDKIAWVNVNMQLADMKAYSQMHQGSKKIAALVAEAEAIQNSGGSWKDAKAKIDEASLIKQKNEASTKQKAEKAMKAKAAKLAQEKLDVENKIADVKNQIASTTDKKALGKLKKELASLESKLDVLISQADDRFSQDRKDAAVWDTGDGAAAENALHASAQRAWTSASVVERGYMYDYTKHYCDVNEPLTLRVYQNSQDRSKFDEKVNAMTSYIEKSELDHDQWFQRGVSGIGVIQSMLEFGGGKWPGDPSKLVGMEITNGAFMSCGSQKGHGFSGGVIMNVYAPKGSKAAYVEPFSAYGCGAHGTSWDGKTRYKIFSSEHETIFQRGTIMRVTKVEYVGGTYYIDVEVVGRELKDLSYVPDHYVSSVKY